MTALVRAALTAALTIVVAGAGRVSNDVLLPTAQHVRPQGVLVHFPGRPADVAVNPTGDVAAIKNSDGIAFLDIKKMRVVQNLQLTREHVHYPANLGGNGFLGIAWSPNGKTVWQADGYGLLRSATRQPNGRYSWDRDIELPGPTGVFRNRRGELDMSVPTGLAVSSDGRTIYVALSRNNSIAIVDSATRRTSNQLRVGIAPLGVAVRGATLFVSNLGGSAPAPGSPAADSAGTRVAVNPATGIANSGTVTVLDSTRRRVLKEIPVGLHPGAMALTEDGRTLFVANANSDTLSEIDTSSFKVVATIHVPAPEGFGSAPVALLLAPHHLLFVAEGGTNEIDVLNYATRHFVGRLSAGWYPSGLAWSHGGALVVTDMKGLGSTGRDLGFPRKDLGFRLFVSPNAQGYNVYDWAGLAQRIDDPSSILNPVRTEADIAPALSSSSPHLPPFKHVVYIIKENHTYDDYFGDLVHGNGSPELCAFPRAISPNHHALAERFGLFDNFFVNGNMSGDGHQWTDEADTTDYVERNVSSWARSYPSDGTDPLAFASSGFVWTHVLKAGLSFRDYGEFVTSEPTFTPVMATWLDFYRDRLNKTHRASFVNEINVASLRPYVSADYAGFTLRITDQARADVFEGDLQRWAATGSMPSLIMMLLGNDHTAGTQPGYPTPRAAVADNDLALGRIVDAISHSRFWADTVIFVVEDDAQNGLDHVDGHRTMALVISAYNRPGAVDSHFYNQTSIVATIDRVFGLQPLTRFDATSPLITAPFEETAHLEPYSALPNTIPLDELNPKTTALRGWRRLDAIASSRMNFDRADAADPRLLRQIVRDSLKR